MDIIQQGTGILSVIYIFHSSQAKVKPLSLTFSPMGKLFVVMGGSVCSIFSLVESSIRPFTEQQVNSESTYTERGKKPLRSPHHDA